jgi:hypothetical protein
LSAALACVKLAVGVFELKFQFNEFENVESYIDELMSVTARFRDSEEFTTQSAVCLCNLLQLCPYDRGVFASRMIEVLSRIEELAGHFPDNEVLQLCYLRSLVFFLCYGKPRLKDDIYEQYYQQTKTAFGMRKELISESDFDDMRYALRENGIII